MSDSPLDYDCLVLIFSYLSPVELENSCLVCHEWYEIARTNLLWKSLSSNFYIPDDFDIYIMVFYFLLNFGLTRWEERFESDYRRLYQLKVEQDRSWLKGKYVTAPHHVHEHSVRGVSFSPITPSVFASCGIYFYLFVFIIFTFFYSLLLGYDSTAHVYNVNSFPSPTHSYMPQALGGIINNWERYAQFLVLKLHLYWSILVFLELSGLVMEGI